MANSPQLSLSNLKKWLDTGRFDAAEQLANRILTETPFEPNAHHALGVLLMRKGNHAGAIAHLEQASARLSSMPDVWLNLGSAYRLQKRLGAARAAYEQALSIEPRYLAALLNSTELALDRDDYYEAEHYASRALSIDSTNITALTNLAKALSCTGRFDAALEVLQVLLSRGGKQRAAVARNMVTLMLRLDRAADAEAFCERYENSASDRNEFLTIRAEILAAQGKQSASLDLYRKVFGAKNTQLSAEANFGFAAQLLYASHLEEGWRIHRDRYRLASMLKEQHRSTLPKLDGGRFEGKRVLLVSEQGIGDEIWYASLLPEVLSQTSGAAIAVTSRLCSLFARSFPGTPVVEKIPGKPLDAGLSGLDWYALYADAAETLRPDLSSFDRQPVAYLTAEPVLRAGWQNTLARISAGKPVIGISWRSTRAKKDAVGFTYPSIKHVALLMRSIDACWINLQYDDPDGKEATALADLAGVPLHTLDGLDLNDDIEGQAAVISAMRAVVGPANAPVVLAAALGVPTVSFWARSLRIFWRTHGLDDRTPWFKSMKLAARRVNESWDAVMPRAISMLTDELADGK